MKLRRIGRFSLVLNLLLALVLPAITPAKAHAQLTRTLMKGAVCGGGAFGGFKLGQKVSEMQAKKLKLGSAEAEKQRRAFEIGMALALCGGGVLVTNTVYSKLTKKDMEARDKEMNAALADATPGSRMYVLPDSKLSGTIKTEAVEMEGDKECRTTVDNLAESNEPAMTRYCRKPPNGKFELEL